MKKLIALTLALLGVIALFFYLSPQKTSHLFSVTPAVTSLPTHSPTSSNTSPEASTKIIALTIKNNALRTGPSVLQVHQNQLVVLQILSDTNSEFSLLGYDKHVFLQKGKMVILSFLATATGSFSYILENPRTVLGLISVQN